MTEILSAVTTVTTLVGDVFTVITSNAYLTVFCAASLLGVAVGVFSSIRNAAR